MAASKSMIGLEPTHKFVDEVWDEEIVCSVCSLPQVTPTMHKPCNNSICLECAKKLSFECPSCKEEPGEDSFTQVTLKGMLNILGKVKVECSLCPFVCSISEFETHKKTCEGVVVECGGKQLGCEYSGPRRDLPSHEKDCERFKLCPVFDHLTDQISEQKKEIEELKKTNRAMIHFAGISYVEFPLPGTTEDEKSVRLLSGFYKVRMDFGIADGGEDISVYFRFEEGPFDDMFPKFPFEGKVILSLLSPAHQPIETVSMDSESKGFRKFASKLPSSYGRGWEKLEKLEVVKRKLDGNKLWFSVKIERKA